MLPTKKIIDEALLANDWDFGNAVLYNLCSENFEHKVANIIIAKVWLIGRAYAAAIERRKNKTDINDDFYVEKVAPIFQNSQLDNYLGELKKYKFISSENIELILRTHKYLMLEIKKITGMKKRSLCSKYLHFHLPELFFIYDSRAVNALRSFTSKMPNELSYLTKNKIGDSVYSKFFAKCFDLKNKIEKEYQLTLTNRQFDKILILTANKKL